MEKLNVLGTVVEIDDSLVEYNKIRKEFAAKAAAASEEFRETYDEYGNYEEFLENFNGDVAYLIQQTVSDCIKRLVDNGVLEVDEQRFYSENKYVGGDFLKLVDEIEASFQEVDDKLRNNVAYRKARKEDRGRFVGGGFGMGAAVEATVKAGALNMATGAAHTVFNAIGNSIDSMGAESEKESIYKSTETIEKLCDCLYTAVFRCHLALIKYLSQFNIDKRPYDGMIKDNAKKSAEVILNNTSKIDDDDNCRNALIDSLLKNPYQAKWYDYVLKRFGDADGTLEAAAEYFGCTEVRLQKSAMVAQFVTANDLSLDTEEEALHTLEEVKRYKETIYFLGKSETEVEIEKKLKIFDEDARTVECVLFNTQEADYILFDTREEAKVASQEYEQLSSKLKDLNRQNLQELKDFRDFLKGLSSEKLVEKYNEDIEEQIKDLTFAEEHQEEVKKAKIIVRVSLCILALLIVVSYILPLYASRGLYQSRMQILSIPLIVQGHKFVETPNFIGGVVNGIVVFGRSIGDVVVGGINEYLDGFGGWLIWNFIWFFLGIAWISVKQIIAVIPRMLISIIRVFFQHATLGYYVGFILGIMLPCCCIALSSGKNFREKVEATQGVTKEKVKKIAIVVVCIALFSILILDRF